jgi:uncharacterized RDD family membrane protein YckC
MSGPGSSPQPPPPAAPPPGGNWSPSPAAQVGPAGLVYADVPNRVMAFIIDAIILFVINFIVFAILGAIGLNPWTPNPNATGLGDLLSYNPVVGLIQALVGLAVSAGYFIYTWTSMRGTPGQKMLGMQVGNAADGATLTMEQGLRRWIALFAPSVIAQALFPWPLLGTIIGLAAFIWVIALIVTTAQSPTKQGLHDTFAKTIVVKAARTVA